MSHDPTAAGRPATTSAHIISLSDDSYVRLTHGALLGVSLAHLISGVDDECPDSIGRGMDVSPIRGYTEWVSTLTPVLSVGWDWRMNGSSGRVRCERLATPRSNVMLIDDQGRDLGAARTAELLGAVVDALGWQAEVIADITSRYS